MKFSAYITAATLLWHAIAGCTCGARHVHLDVEQQAAAECHDGHDHHVPAECGQKSSFSRYLTTGYLTTHHPAPQHPVPCQQNECEPCHCVELSHKTPRSSAGGVAVERAIGQIILPPLAIESPAVLQQRRLSFEAGVDPPPRPDLAIAVLLL